MTSIPSKRPFEDSSGRAAGGFETNEDDGLKKRTKTTKNDGAVDSAAAASDALLRSLSIKDSYRTNDEIHSTIDFCPVMAAVVNTPPVQRLRALKQLGAADLVYMCANHSRFEHSCGVAHLASRLCKKIQKTQKELGVTDKEVLVVTLAGLLHDVGHGPFSHVYEQFVKKKLPAYLDRNEGLRENYQGLKEVDREKWGHEKVSLEMVDKVLEHLGLQIDLDNLDKPLKQIGYGENAVDAKSMRVIPASGSGDDLLTSRDWVCVKECIWGKPIPAINEYLKKDGFVGRPEREKEWLYQIVNNDHSGLDVDKMDYFARDGRRCFKESGEVRDLLIENACVAWAPRDVEGAETGESKQGKHLHICYPDKTVEEAITFFKKRFELHTKIYKHKTIRAAGTMICDILCKADPFFRLRGYGKNSGLPISQAMQDCDVFLNLRDSVIDQILADPNPDLKESQRLIERLRTRNLYKCAAETTIRVQSDLGKLLAPKKEAQIHEEILAIGGYHDIENGNPIDLSADDFLIDISDLHHGRKSRNPVESMRFLEKIQMFELNMPASQLPDAHAVDMADYEAHLPQSWRKMIIRAYSRDAAKADLVYHAFQSWLSQMKERSEHGVSGTTTCFASSNVVALSQEEEDEDDHYMLQSPMPEHRSTKPITPGVAAAAKKL